ncbi:6-phosphofructokinase [Sulfurimonas sp. MAG313]|nr:6-phosphofructokinase [Sulfurimonas sp. MAG313]MDF1880112.1 6-phosphofructokinase [Sulfurimonas sp. MAG313]
MSQIAILCSGGDVSGMNPALKRFVEYSFEKGLIPYFVQGGYEGLIDNLIVKASYNDVTGIIHRGGTKIYSARSKRFMQKKHRNTAAMNLKAQGIDKLVVLGGDGSFRGMDVFFKEQAISFCGIPATIDNDINGTQYCLGVDTALNVIKVATDNIRDTASSFKRAFVIEVMGNDCGYLALVSALTSGAEMCLIPEIQYDLEKLKIRYLKEVEQGRNYFIAIVAEGLANAKEIAQWFEDEIGFESRVTTLGHIQRGGNPTVKERLMAYQFCTYAIDSLLSGKSNSVICYNNGKFDFKEIYEINSKKYEIDKSLVSLGKSLLSK